jgi:hypothetical protein
VIPPRICAPQSSVGLVPLTDLGDRTYAGAPGGLDAGVPAEHAARGLARAAAIVPLDRGVPSEAGRVVVASIGMSQTHAAFAKLAELAANDPRVSPRVALVNAARGGVDALRAVDPASAYWGHVDRCLRAAGASREDVQVAWLKQGIANESRPFPEDAEALAGLLDAIATHLGARFPRLSLVYVSSRAYGGYSEVDINREPHAYHSAFAVRALIARRARAAERPWIGWGPYFWADGVVPRGDGLTWERADFAGDGLHLSPRGAEKQARMLLDFFATEPTARPWFLR